MYDTLHRLHNARAEIRKVRYLSQETLQNPRIVRVGDPQFFRGIAEDIRRIVERSPRNRQRVSADL